MVRGLKSRARRARGVPKAPRVTLSDDWRAWIVENAVSGASRDELVSALLDGGVARALALREVDAILTSPAMPGCLKLRARAERSELVLSLFRELATHAAHPEDVERRETVSADELYDSYFSAARPVVLTQMLKNWPALRKWTPEYFAERFGDLEIEVTTNRDADPDCDRHIDRHRQKMTMAEYARLVRSRGVTNDIYLVSNNRAFERPELRVLLEDLTPPEDIFEVPVRPGYASLWFGPAGTHTPLHHDTTNILVCQIYGKKRIKLISPFSTTLLHSAEGFYASKQWESLLEDEAHRPNVRTVELSAGEALFLPAGYWHEVTAIEPSIHVSLLAFRRPNAVKWYRPGFIGTRQA